MGTELVLERREQAEPPPIAGGLIALTPAIDEDYWSYRVKLTDSQAVVGFPKFGTIGIGFAVEGSSWNTNLPYTSGIQTIFKHILRNKGDESIRDYDVRAAIEMIIIAVREDRGI